MLITEGTNTSGDCEKGSISFFIQQHIKTPFAFSHYLSLVGNNSQTLHSHYLSLLRSNS